MNGHYVSTEIQLRLFEYLDDSVALNAQDFQVVEGVHVLQFGDLVLAQIELL